MRKATKEHLEVVDQVVDRKRYFGLIAIGSLANTVIVGGISILGYVGVKRFLENRKSN
jgi:hypothetical protein